MAKATNQGTYELVDVRLQNGSVLREAKLSWRTHGTLALDKDNAIVYPTSYAAQTPKLFGGLTRGSEHYAPKLQVGLCPCVGRKSLVVTHMGNQ